MSKETFTGQKCHRESCASTPCWQGIPLSCWSKIIGLISLKAKWQWSSPQFADIYAITRPLSIPLTTTETCMATMKIQQDHDSQHTTCSELLRKPVWKLQACCSIPRFMGLRFSLDLFFKWMSKILRVKLELFGKYGDYKGFSTMLLLGHTNSKHLASFTVI